MPRTPAIETEVAALHDRLVERMAAGTLELPVLPDAAVQVLSACRDDEAGPRQVADTMQRDPALAGYVLRVANSAAFAGGASVVSLSQAVARLGLSTVAEITVAAALRGRVFHAERYTSELRVLWKHSALAGPWAREIARRRRRSVEGAFLCGLLHDVGRPVILQAVVEMERSAGARHSEEAISAVADQLHGEVGASLVARWGLPEWMASAIRWHHDPEQAQEHLEAAMTTALADALAHWSDERPDDEGHDELQALPAVAALGLYPDDVEAVLERRGDVIAAADGLS